jgi:uncharacterized membrane protein YphA (DoxX/SURF4 family)
MEVTMFIGRILFAVMFILGGINHFTHAEAMTGYAQHKGVPAAKLANLVSGAILVLGGLSVILGIYADLGALAVSVVLIVMAVMMHDFWKQSDAQAKQTEMISFLKNISMAGGGLFMYAVMATEGYKYGPAITDSLFSAAP